MRRWLALLVIVPACAPEFGVARDGGAGDGDGQNDGSGSEGMEPMIDARACYGTAVKVCFTVVPTNPVALVANGIVINTDGTTVCDQHNDKASVYCVFAGAGFVLSGNNTITAHGSKPLVLLSTTTMTLEGEVDVSSKRDRLPGAGAAIACANSDIVEATGTSGGYGGSFGGRGGDGEQVIGPVGDMRGVAAPATTFPMTLRGGCPGGAGAMGVGVAGRGLGGAGGAGGGAVALVATSIKVDGTINASGAGGRGGPTVAESGGGGGGAGGMIVIDSSMPLVATNRAKVFANGGGGGQGGEFNEKGGVDGGESTGPATAGAGGVKSGTDAGTGGAGSSGSNPAGGMTPNDSRLNGTGGGGAGGGAGGFVHAPGVPETAVAPPSLDVPQ